MALSITFSEEKNQLLKSTRGISFEEVILAIKNGDLVLDKKHHRQEFKHQRMFVVSIGGYAYAVPYVINEQKEEIFLKTIYPSRVLTKKYLKGGK